MRGGAGEIAAAYADGAMTLEQTIRVAFERASRAMACGGEPGLMAAVGLSAEDADAYIAKHNAEGVVVACDNGPRSVTLSGRAARLQVKS